MLYVHVAAGASGAEAGPPGVDAAAQRIDAVTARHHVQLLADDKLEGRGAGTPGGRAAASYIARRLASYGLEPAGTGRGDDAWFQEFSVGGVRCRNVVAMRRGRDARRKDEHVVVGAHYDHVGRGEAGNGMPTLSGIFRGGDGKGEVHNGADDNASGSAALLEIAAAVAALDPAPARTIVFVWFDGEERGLWGSRHYCDEPALPLARCAGMLNMDEVGRARGDRVQVIGANSGRGLLEAIAGENERVGLGLDVDPFMVPNSDHFSFYSRRVPVAFFFTGLHPDYHRPGDDWQKLDYETLARVARLVFRAAVRLAEAEEAPAFAEVPSAPLGALALEFGYAFTGADVLLDLQRDAYGPIAGAFVRGAARGLEVAFVVPGSPAGRAGLRAGDRIAAVNGRKVAGPLGRLRLLAASRRYEALKLEVARGAERTWLEVRTEGAREAPRKGRRERQPELF